MLNDGLDAVLTLALGGLGLWLGDLMGCVAGVMAGSVLTLATGLWAARHWHAFTFPLTGLCRIGTATALMAVVVARFGAQGSAGSIAGAILLGAVVYGTALAAAYPAASANAARLLQGALGTVWARTRAVRWS